ncbi:MAG: hypothetical protein J6Y62_03975 [Clostridia bacterium]|nr:hypothetical protein [Clostridia bacterium]
MKKDRLVGSRWTEEDKVWFERHGFKETEDFSIGPLTNVCSSQISYKLASYTGEFSGNVEAFRNESDEYVVVITWKDEYGKGTGKTLKSAVRRARADFRAMLKDAFKDAGQLLSKTQE